MPVTNMVAYKNYPDNNEYEYSDPAQVAELLRALVAFNAGEPALTWDELLQRTAPDVLVSAARIVNGHAQAESVAA